MNELNLPHYHISVRPLVEYVFRSGSIDSRFQAPTSLSEGTRAHQKIQKTYNEGDQKEVPLKLSIEHGGFLFELEGRCDGLLFGEKGNIIIDEIKSTAAGIEGILIDSYPVHLAQAKCYAYMFSMDKGIKEISIQLTYVDSKTDDLKRFHQTFSFQQLESFIKEILEDFLPFARMLSEHKNLCRQSIKDLVFPFKTYRKGQKKLAASVYDAIKGKKELFLRAPTGIGKTISTIFPSVKAVGEEEIDHLFYLTAKTITRQTAEESFQLLEKEGLHFKTVTLTAKDKVCLNDTTSCQKDMCPFADGYYDRINGAILDIYKNKNNITRGTIEEYSKKHRVCPFEFSLDLAYIADAVICDYNYIFDPRISLKRFSEEYKKRSLLLIDEAHNLVDRARGMFSGSLMKSPFLNIKRSYKGKNQRIFESAKNINQYFIDLKKEADNRKEWILSEFPDNLFKLAAEFNSRTEEELASGSTDTELLDAYFMTLAFVKTAALFDDHYAIMIQADRKEATIKLFCLDPSLLLSKMGKNYHSKVYFSATFTPMNYFKEMLGANNEAMEVSIDSPFASSQTEVFIYPISTRYKGREKSYNPIAKTINDLITVRPGNYLVFFPSYQYLMETFEAFKEIDAMTETIIQSRGMAESEREAFLASFQEENKNSLVGFAVLGGVFSEGVDLKGERLNGVVCVGVGLPQVGLERNIIKDYYRAQGSNGFDYSYVYPGMNKVLQAAGRLIRSEDDYGTIVLMDDRFLENKYQKLLPQEWKDFRII
ncbi:ATP-dependent DNA helicase [Neobacillus terrae]|uniref:ATP-dependent DNA helicase n=1 Tax=Neobacillus terrae TaxID=3034837 RepID=UPI00140C1952|nr:ATP-dependent DNA helicase [Neobacillus terrae]NHM31077.1 ATP-dependent DNA helicase [Neobacillus terrae]